MPNCFPPPGLPLANWFPPPGLLLAYFRFPPPGLLLTIGFRPLAIGSRPLASPWPPSQKGLVI